MTERTTLNYQTDDEKKKLERFAQGYNMVF